jgi:Histidine kinase-, DNA gyrase B-, and HSP90-like ATPase
MNKSVGESVFLDVPPDPERTSEGLRDTGYEFPTAVADIIDNSIAAGANTIDVTLARDFGGAILVAVADDGCGMDRDGLINAMRYGSKRREDASSLGKFGLGLKTASTAFCRRLSVVSRPSADAPALKATWDLDHIAEIGKWELRLGDPPAHEVKLLDGIARGKSGTLVIWEKVDRLLRDYAKPDGKPAKAALKRYEDDLRFHMGMVYQRFLDPTDARARTVVMRLNGVEVSPWDPYCTGVTGKPVLEQKMEVAIGPTERATFTLRAFVLPAKDEWKDLEARREARLTNEMQGIYVYRENRRIHGPDWLGMYRKEPHLTLCRVELSFDHKLDDAFQVDIKKSRILLDETLYEWLRDKFLPGPRREAEVRYRKGVDAVITGTAALLHAASNTAIHAKADNLKTADLTEVDGTTGNVTISNKLGTTKLKIRLIEPESAGQLHVQPTDSLQDGMLWEPAFIEGNQAVRINTGHPYYHKVYVPNQKSGVTIQGLDSLMWALCAAELGNVSEETKKNFEEMRYEVSRILRKLVEDLPEPSEPEGESA